MQGTSAYLEITDYWERSSDSIFDFKNTQDSYQNLILAIRQGNLEDAKSAIDSLELCTPTNFLDSYNLVIEAVNCGRVCILRLLISLGAIVNKPSRRFTPLHLACLKGSSELAQCLLEAGADIEIRNGEGKTPLHFAVQAEMIQSELSKFGRSRSYQYYRYLSQSLTLLLIQHGATLNCMDYSGMTPFHYAVKEKNDSVVSVLLESSADIEMTDRFGRTPLWYAANAGSKELVLTLLKAGAQLDRADELGLTVLHVSVVKDNMAMTRFLLRSSFRRALNNIVNKPCSRGESCLHFAVSNLNTCIIDALIDFGADVNQKNTEGNTPLISACLASPNKNSYLPCEKEYKSVGSLSHDHRCKHCTTVFLLIERNADVKCTNGMGETALHLAAKHNLLCVAKILIENGAEMDAKDSDGLTPVHHAIENQGLEMTRILLESRADADARGVEYLTPLHLAVIRAGGAEERAPELVQLLIDYDADVNAKNLMGLTPLHLVLRNSLTAKSSSLATDSRIIDTLLQNGANVFARSNFGRTPFSIAAGWYSTSLEHTCDSLSEILRGICLFGIKVAVASADVLDIESNQLMIELIESEGEHNFYTSCVAEVTSMKSNCVIVDIPYYNLLNLSVEKLANYLRNPNFEEALSQASLLDVFPIYGPLIRSKFSKALERKEYFDSGRHFFSFLSDFFSYPRLPVICVELILKYLKNNDFRHIKKVL